MWRSWAAAAPRRRGCYCPRALGSAIGNTTSAERAALIGDVAKTLEPGDRFLITADLVKLAPVLDAACNDAPGATAQARFRLNQLAHFSRCFDGDVVLHRSYPRAHYVPETMTVEGHRYATEDQTVTLRALDYTLTLRRGEPICHGHSVKFHRPEFVDTVCGACSATVTQGAGTSGQLCPPPCY